MSTCKPSKFGRALQIARKHRGEFSNWEHARDYLDQAMAGDLDAWQLDKAADEAMKDVRP